MASTNKTENVGLSQFLATDKPSWLADYNNDMQKIDDTVKRIDADVTQVSNSARKVLELVYPVGSYYTSSISTNPADLFGFGIWERVKGRIVVGVDENNADFATAGKQGGAKSVTIKKENIPHYELPTTGVKWVGGNSGNISFQDGLKAWSDAPNISGGSGHALNIMNPYETAYIWKRTA